LLDSDEKVISGVRLAIGNSPMVAMSRRPNGSRKFLARTGPCGFFRFRDAQIHATDGGTFDNWLLHTHSRLVNTKRHDRSSQGRVFLYGIVPTLFAPSVAIDFVEFCASLELNAHIRDSRL
jgi:hypothetical protein